MASERERDIVYELSEFLLDVIMLGNPPEIPTRFASIESLQTLYLNLISLRESLYAASNGHLSGQVPFKGYVAGTLKTLQANLRHITWQTKMIASGDFTQRVEFMGDFSQSFNSMVMQLDQGLKELVNKKRELGKVNEDLLKEIAIRKQTEATLRESEEALKLLATTDSITGLYNRRHFNKLAEDEISRSLRYSRPLSVVMFDIDFFKHINDTFGHTTGDVAITMVASATKTIVRTNDIPARYGGEEFIVLLPETPSAKAAAVAERLRRRIEEMNIPTEGPPVTITASFGVSDHLGKTESKSCERILSEFVTSVDRALYASKDAGKNRVTIYKPEDRSLP